MQEGEEEEETSSRSIKNNKLDVFPNPAKDIINIKLSLKETNSISVGLFDIGGRLIYEHKSNLNVHDQFSHKINVQGLDRGLYLVRIYTDKEQFARKISIH